MQCKSSQATTKIKFIVKLIRSSKSQATVDRVSYIYFCQNSKRHFQNKSRSCFHTVKAAEDWSLMVTNCSTLDGARQALLGVTVFPAILKTLSDLELLELQRQSVPCGREEEIGFRASSTKAVGRLHCLHLATVRSSSTPFQTCSAAKFSLRNFFTTLLEGTRLLDF